MPNKIIEELIRDATKVGSIPKSEMRRRLNELVQSAINKAIEKFADGAETIRKIELNKATQSAKKEAVEECIKLSDEIEGQYSSTEFNEWRAFKGFRNTLRDKLKGLK